MAAPPPAPARRVWNTRRMGDFFRISELETARVIELSLPSHVDDHDFDRLSTGLLETVSRTPATAWILDLAAAEYVGSALLGLMVNLRQAIRQTQGALVLCSMPDYLMEIVQITSMQRLFIICRTRDEAVRRIADWK